MKTSITKKDPSVVPLAHPSLAAGAGHRATTANPTLHLQPYLFPRSLPSFVSTQQMSRYSCGEVIYLRLMSIGLNLHQVSQNALVHTGELGERGH
ncbi:hypothetical protein ElyMa_002602600 [Elysia marginata]|uniref:Uncharacterized protein n=1 Tax=Elysia marginata TaxID=1093978 RepID=A0AAV4H471_9GAST|nr:hypothetical protein ElyMa_002602600 [Elysia marginata]